MRIHANKLSLITLPTPLQYLPSASQALGIELYIKRDDLTDFGLGGNKLRKLEYLLYEAKAQGATLCVTSGGLQTNHGRLTAAACAKLGLKCIIACMDSYDGEMTGNILLDRLMGAEVVYQPPGADGGYPGSPSYNAFIEQVVADAQAAGEQVYLIPGGGSNALGAMGYYEAACELTAQAEALGLGDARVVTAAGSLGTYMGLFCGLRGEGSPLRLTGIAVAPMGDGLDARLLDYFEQFRAAFPIAYNAQAQEFDIETGYTYGGYNNPVFEVREAIRFLARQEGILLDPCYTGKAFNGLMQMVQCGKIRPGERVIFLHTGGVPGLYTPQHRQAFQQEMGDGVRCMPPRG